MNKYTDPTYLKTQQYKDDSNLNARIQVHRCFSTNKQGLFRWLFNHLKLAPNSRILELGCGSGAFWLEVLDDIPPDWALTLSDLSEGMLQNARDNLGAVHQQVEYKLIDAQQIPYGEDHFDAVMANFMLYHVPDRNKAISEIQRVLKPGGRLYAVTNGLHHMQEVRALITSIDPEIDMTSAGTLFALENGHEQLAQQFAQVELQRYKDSLEVTEVEPLVNYVLSMKRSDRIETDSQRLRDIIRSEIESRGAFHITKDSGLFIATKQERQIF